MSFELSCIATCRSVPLASNFCLLRWLTLYGKGYFQLWKYPFCYLICSYNTFLKCFVSISFIDTCILPWELLCKGIYLDIQKTLHILMCFVIYSSSIKVQSDAFACRLYDHRVSPMEVTSLAGFWTSLNNLLLEAGSGVMPDQVNWALSTWGLKWLCFCFTLQECCDTTWSPGLTQIE